ncbi:hypothetical protein PhCBS80983_g02213 [Powellomyces hirtus]|uniref:Uncharacterized protein n=1 Tax=Powellomyces hirtus TaxID=109895 RepID=A0A507E6Y3_9FUNG|nr:hypothetical protein PhCBS80983_g02213 [Powellomyces hirtus]
MATAGTLWFAGDLISQKFVDRKAIPDSSTQKDFNNQQLEPFPPPSGDVDKWKMGGVDWRRVATMTSFGVFFAGPMYTFWYRLLDQKIVAYFERVMKKKIQETTTLNVSKTNLKWKIAITKVLADMLIFDPPFLCFFFLSTHMLSGLSFESGVEQMKRDVLPTYAIDIAVWSPIQLANFRWVPVLYQPVVVNSVNVGWNAYLSFVKHRDVAFD